MRRALVKIGGAQIESAEGRARLARSIVRAREAGWQLVLVHGGGPQIAALCARLGLEERRHRGLRVTDAATAEVVLLALAGGVNKELVRALGAGGVPAVGLCGADGGLFEAVPLASDGIDLGYVGVPGRIEPKLALDLLERGWVPVVATVASGRLDEPFRNVNADHAAGPLAAALGARALVYLTDVPGVLDAERKPLGVLARAEAEGLIASGVIAGGMIPKVETALAALAAAPGAAVTIAPGAGAAGRGDDAVLDALDGRTGTRFVERAAIATAQGGR